VLVIVFETECRIDHEYEHHFIEPEQDEKRKDIGKDERLILGTRIENEKSPRY
jgi:hypothetical protein